MPRGPKGEKRPVDVIGNAVHVMRIATGEVEEKVAPPDPAKEHMRRGGIAGGKARAASLTKKRRSEIARKAAASRWRRRRPRP
jgi:hypothetical protein